METTTRKSARTSDVLEVVLLLIGIVAFSTADAAMPEPFTRVLYVKEPEFSGNDVIILQNLLLRSQFVSSNLTVSGSYDTFTEQAVSDFQLGNKLPVKKYGTFEEVTANRLLTLHMDDGYKDNGTIPAGFLYKVYIPVHRNRSIEITATLFDSDMNVLHKFTVRTHGQNDASGHDINQLSPSGNTPTGLCTFDLNSPEKDPKEFGPYPINRAVQGLEGNMKFLISNIRDGILMHTGEWPDWNPSKPMPNSHGCVHGHPEDIKYVWQVLVEKGVVVHPNTFGKLPYPYKPQGILSIEQVD